MDMMKALQILAIGMVSVFLVTPATAMPGHSETCQVESFAQPRSPGGGSSGSDMGAANESNKLVDHGTPPGSDRPDLSSSEKSNLGAGESTADRAARGTGGPGNSRTAVPPC